MMFLGAVSVIVISLSLFAGTLYLSTSQKERLVKNTLETLRADRTMMMKSNRLSMTERRKGRFFS